MHNWNDLKCSDAPFSPSTVGKHLLVAYWGQNSAEIKNPENPEKTLKDVCEKMKYDIIIIGFVVTFFGASNKGEVRTTRTTISPWMWPLTHPHFAMNAVTVLVM